MPFPERENREPSRAPPPHATQCAPCRFRGAQRPRIKATTHTTGQFTQGPITHPRVGFVGCDLTALSVRFLDLISSFFLSTPTSPFCGQPSSDLVPCYVCDLNNQHRKQHRLLLFSSPLSGNLWETTHRPCREAAAKATNAHTARRARRASVLFFLVFS